ncbi:MBL fold metallo-hydrolase, partial [Mesorhizobium sp.]|uniref:MBL fold metallo-hydrolase n=1 Tax=Mesorhizobium sp. TaxID=1871066 RepID=UPI00257BEC20
MFTRRAIMKTTLAAGAAAVFAPAGLAHAAGGLSWKHFPAGENGFFRAPVLITGASEALLIDGGFTYSDGRAVAEAIKATGKTLTTIYVSQSDPDYYFGLKPIKDAFPQARVIAAAETVAAINGSVDKKIAVWGPQLKENGPQALADIVIPEVFDGKTLTVDGEAIEIVDAEGLANRRYLSVPSLNAVFGGVMIFSGVHVWT